MAAQGRGCSNAPRNMQTGQKCRNPILPNHSLLSMGVPVSPVSPSSSPWRASWPPPTHTLFRELVSRESTQNYGMGRLCLQQTYLNLPSGSAPSLARSAAEARPRVLPRREVRPHGHWRATPSSRSAGPLPRAGLRAQGSRGPRPRSLSRVGPGQGQALDGLGLQTRTSGCRGPLCPPSETPAPCWTACCCPAVARRWPEVARQQDGVWPPHGPPR